MTNEQINIAIAEQFPQLFIIRKPMYAPFQYYRVDACGYTNNIADAWKVSEDVARKHSCGSESDFDRVIYEPAPLPNYAADLNACHAAMLNHPRKELLRRFLYLEVLEDPTNTTNEPAWANAKQFSTAYVKSIGKWKE